MAQATRNAIQLLRDLSAVINALPDQVYHTPIKHLSNGTIGQHTRHIIECYQCLVSQSPARVVNYTLRKRDTSLESDPYKAIEVIQQLITTLPILDEDTPLALYTEERQAVAIPSNIMRELYHNAEHTIHHMAIIRIGLAIIAPQFKLPDHFGIAPATIRHRQLQNN